MRGSKVLAVLAAGWLSACSQTAHDAGSHDMQASLDKLRSMIAQSALMASQAVCATPAERSPLIAASTVLLRRATSGPEMTALHRMMGGEMNMDKEGGMAMDKSKTPSSPDQAMHIAVHAAGGATFDLLDAATAPPGLSCADLGPVAVAASAALLRQQHGEGGDEATKKLEKDMDDTAVKLGGEAKQSLGEQVPAVVRTLVEDLAKI